MPWVEEGGGDDAERPTLGGPEALDVGVLADVDPAQETKKVEKCTTVPLLCDIRKIEKHKKVPSTVNRVTRAARSAAPRR